MDIDNISKRKIVRSFLNLVVRSQFNEISINDILNETGISRGTFYNHFNNKNDILNYIENRFFDEIDIIYTKVKSDNSNYIQILTDNVFPYLYDHREYLLVLYMKFQSSFFKVAFSRYAHFFNKLLSDYDKTQLNLSNKFVARYFFTMIINAIIIWLDDPFPITPEEFKVSFLKLMNTSLKEVCGREIK